MNITKKVEQNRIKIFVFLIFFLIYICSQPQPINSDPTKTDFNRDLKSAGNPGNFTLFIDD